MSLPKSEYKIFYPIGRKEYVNHHSNRFGLLSFCPVSIYVLGKEWDNSGQICIWNENNQTKRALVRGDGKIFNKPDILPQLSFIKNIVDNAKTVDGYLYSL